MNTTLTRHLSVATCIGCGARSHSADCPDGCTDLPLDLVDVDALVAIATRAEALDDRIATLREVVRALAVDGPVDWPAVQARPGLPCGWWSLQHRGDDTPCPYPPCRTSPRCPAHADGRTGGSAPSWAARTTASRSRRKDSTAFTPSVRAHPASRSR